MAGVPILSGVCDNGVFPGVGDAGFGRFAMDRLLRMDKERYVREMRAEMERVLGEVADAVNDAADGNVINGSEMRVRDLMAELRRTAFEKAVQMRIDSTESSFSPSQGLERQAQAEQGPGVADDPVDQRPDRGASGSLARRGRGERRPG